MTSRAPGTGAVDQACRRLAPLACPRCRGDLKFGSERANCACGAVFQIRDGIHMMLAEPGQQARRQAEWFDHEAAAEWEIERPRGGPPLYAWLMEEKFRRSTEGLALRGARVLAVCAGSGMDAEFLAEMGAGVIALDISFGAVQRTAERARRHGFEVLPVVGDVEHLPFRDASVDVVYVHDGLHHLEDPFRGLSEMARVARCAVCVSEPAQAQITALAVRLGLALEREPAGNRVGRLATDVVAAELQQRGFHVACRRYGMYYRHEPGRVLRIMSRPGLIDLATAVFRLANAAVGRFGNKLAIVAIRR
jgi:ubiquinone/menaquinone biosynthesis C-methylase UbiE/uncharacterized protein YbaR (Trm112 family)